MFKERSLLNTMQNLKFDKKDQIATITINRPEKLNALNMAVMGELREAFTAVKDDPEIRVALLTGAGEKAFVAGADIGELNKNNPVEAKAYTHKGQAVLDLIENLGKPVIACINGYALGGGCELALACTFRIASENAKLGQPEVKLGIIAGYGGTQRLPRLVGRGRALELLLTGEPIDAAEAHRIGLVNHVVPQEQLVEFARGLLRKMFTNGPVALALTMQAVDVGGNCGIEDGLRFEAAAFGLAAATEDRREGTRAFLEKRAPAFAGR